MSEGAGDWGKPSLAGRLELLNLALAITYLCAPVIISLLAARISQSVLVSYALRALCVRREQTEAACVAGGARARETERYLEAYVHYLLHGIVRFSNSASTLGAGKATSWRRPGRPREALRPT